MTRRRSSSWAVTLTRMTFSVKRHASDELDAQAATECPPARQALAIGDRDRGFKLCFLTGRPALRVVAQQAGETVTVSTVFWGLSSAPSGRTVRSPDCSRDLAVAAPQQTAAGCEDVQFLRRSWRVLLRTLAGQPRCSNAAQRYKRPRARAAAAARHSKIPHHT